MRSRPGAAPHIRWWRTVAALGATLALVAGLVAVSAPASAQTSPAGPSLVDNGSFEAPDLSAWSGSGGADLARVRTPSSFHGGHALEVTSGGLPGSGVTTAAAREADAGSHQLTLAVKATASSVGKVVRAVVVDPASGRRSTSAAVHLQPWWQTVAVTADTGEGRLTFAVEEQPSGEVWTAGDRYLVDAVEAGSAEPTVASTSGRQLLVDGDPYAIKGYTYLAAPVGAPPPIPQAVGTTLNWSSNPAQCQSDAQLMKAAGVNTLRIGFLDVYTPDAYRCMDAFHAAGVGLMWLVNGPEGWQGSNLPAYQEAFWVTLSRTIEAVKDHPATLGYVIGNENSRNATQHRNWFPMLDELARQTKEADPNHVASSGLNNPAFMGACYPDGCWEGVNPELAPNVDLWGFNQYGHAWGYPDSLWDEIVAHDSTRPVWITEFGTDRYWCEAFDPALGFWALNPLTCDGNEGSGEDAQTQADWNTEAWSDIAANLSVDDPDGAVVGGVLFMWSDLWWFAFAGFTGTGTQATHDVSGRHCVNPVTGNVTHFFCNRFPDGHMSPEWFGASHNLYADQPGPRVTTATYDRMGGLFTGESGPTVTVPPSVSAGACSATVTWQTDEPTYPRVDFGMDRTVAAGGVVQSDNFVADRAATGDTAGISHAVTLDGLAPGTTYRGYVRGFDATGRSATAPPVEFTTTNGACG